MPARRLLRSCIVPLLVAALLPVQVAPAQDKAADGGKLDGIYFGLRRLPPTDGSFVSRVAKSYVTFFPDGTVFWRLPGEGRDAFDAAASRKAFPDRWGTYKVVGDEVHLDGVERRFTIKAKREGDKLRMNDPRVTFTPVPGCTGIKLHGLYRRHPSEPGIRFARDGTFEDGGVLSVLGEIQKNDGRLERDDGKGGAGTYAVRDNTLHLKYADGRAKKVAFHVLPTEMADPSPTHVHLLQDTFALQK